MIIAIELAMMTRMVKQVTVEVPDDYRKVPKDGFDDSYIGLMHDVYEADEGMGFLPDGQWGCEEGTHSLIKVCKDTDECELPHPDYRLTKDGTVELVEATFGVEVLMDISEILWPSGDKDHEWNADTTDSIAHALIEAGYGPKEKK